MGVSRTGLTVSALAVAVVMLSACGGRNMANSSAPHDASLSHSVAPAGGMSRAVDASAEASAPHGPEIESGSVVTITDGNVQKGFPASAKVERTAEGVIVTTAGKTWKFSRAATVSNGGSYHIYAPVSH